MYDRILVPTDGSDEMAAVVPHVLRLADQFDATLHVLSVVDESALTFEMAADRRQRLEDELEAEARRATDRIANRAEDAGIAVVTTVRHGKPPEEIVRYASDADVEMIVMGTHGRSGVDRHLMGSVAERVVRTAEVPVLTVRVAEDAVAVGDRNEAIAVAREALADDGHELATVPEDPYRERFTWVVRAETEAGDVFNVHVDAASGEARLARISGTDEE